MRYQETPFNAHDTILTTYFNSWRTEQEIDKKVVWAQMISRYIEKTYPEYPINSLLCTHNSGLSVKEFPSFKENLAAAPMGKVIPINRALKKTA